jgi:hypothetical protein
MPQPYNTHWFGLLKFKSRALQCTFFSPCGFVLVWRCSCYSQKTPALRHKFLGAAVCILQLGNRWSWRSFLRSRLVRTNVTLGLVAVVNVVKQTCCESRMDSHNGWNLLLDLPTPTEQPATCRVKAECSLTRIGVSLLCLFVRSAIKLL